MGEIKQFRKDGSRCKVCSSGFKDEVDMMLMVAYPMTYIAEWLNSHVPEDMGMEFSKQNIYEHRKRHLKLQSDMLIRLVEKRREFYAAAQDMEWNFAFDYISALEQFVIKGSSEILSNHEEKVKPQDWLKAIDLLHKLDPLGAECNERSYNDLVKIYNVFMRAVGDYVQEDEKDLIRKEIEKEELRIEAPYVPYWLADNSSLKISG